ncbi:MAG TPA: hypothetical protein VF531_13790 [Bacillota bacterium]
MKVTFPYLGPVLAYKKLFEMLGHEVIMPPRPTKRTIELGVKYSPEFICFPFKIILGSYLESVEQGVDLVVTSGGIGACRAVYYGNLSEQILKKLGYHPRFLVFDNILSRFPDFYRQAQVIRDHHPLSRLLYSTYMALSLTYGLDRYEKTIHRLRPYESVTGTCDQKWLEIRNLLSQSNTLPELSSSMRVADQMIAGIATRPNPDLLKIGLVGEIYLVMEGSVNHELMSELALLGVEVNRYRYISDWISHSFWPPRRILSRADHYLRYPLGGHERENIGHIINYKELGYDGVIHLMPFGCMPELVTQAIIPTLSRDLDLPILSLSLDEQTGYLNNRVRLEAFIDLLRNRRELLSRPSGIVRG